jgi:non-homologous end joining protein Ku
VHQRHVRSDAGAAVGAQQLCRVRRRDGRGAQPPGGTVATDETLNLISADKVVGTSVYNDPKKFDDRYDAALLELVKAKMEGRKCQPR